MIRHGFTAWFCFVALGSAFVASPAAAQINTDVALTPRNGGSILRLQYTFRELSGTGAIANQHESSVRGTFLHGITAGIALIMTVPYLNRQTDRIDPQSGRIEDAHDGVGDFTFLLKHRFWQRDDGPGKTARWALLGGINIRSGDSDFTSDSYDPIVGTVFSWRGGRSRFDADLVWQFNTGRGNFRHDFLRYDLAYTHRLFPDVFTSTSTWVLSGVAELNGRYGTDGSHELFLAPGVQFSTERWILEASIQLPVVQELGDVPETDYRLVVGVRFQW